MMGEWRQTWKPTWALLAILILVIVVNDAQSMGLGVLTTASMALAALALLFGGAATIALALVWVSAFLLSPGENSREIVLPELPWWQQLLAVGMVPVGAMTLPALVALLRLLPDAGSRLLLPGRAHQEFKEDYT